MTPMPIIDLELAPTLPKEEIRKFISDFEEWCKAQEQVEVPLEHYFSEKVYGREINLKAGTLLVGKIHKFRSLNILAAGEVTVLSIDGAVRKKAPYTFVSSPGAKRVIYAHTDATWITVHGTDLTDVAQIEEQFIAKSYDDVVEPTVVDVSKEKLCLG